MVNLLIAVVLFALCCYLIFWVLGYLGAPEPLRKVVTVVLVFIGVLWLLSYLPIGQLKPLHW